MPSIESLAELAAELPAALCIASRAGDTVLVWNPECERLLGLAAEEVNGRGLFEAVFPPGQLLGPPADLIGERLASGASGEIEIRFRRRDGAVLPL